MNFAIITCDRYLGVFDAFVSAGWKPLKLFTLPVKDFMGNQQAVIAYAEKHNASIQLSRITTHDLASLQEQGCEALIVASYDWKICEWRPFLKYAVNFHCSPLPDGRGANPAVRAISEKRDSWAVTCHQISQEIDKGDILATDKFSLKADECHESLNLKIQMSAKRLATLVAHDFTRLWEQAMPQEGGSYWKKHTLVDIIINFQLPVEDIMRHIRSFGVTGSLASINNNLFIVRRGVGWTELHNHMAGQVVHTYNNSIVIAVADGYIGLLDTELAPPNLVAEVQCAILANFNQMENNRQL